MRRVPDRRQRGQLRQQPAVVVEQFLRAVALQPVFDLPQVFRGVEAETAIGT